VHTAGAEASGVALVAAGVCGGRAGPFYQVLAQLGQSLGSLPRGSGSQVRQRCGSAVYGRRSPGRASRLVTFGALPAAVLMLPLEFPRMAMNLIEAVLVGIVEGVTYFLPVSGTGHLTSSGGRRCGRSR
jgi:hypothetical protein